MKIKKPSRQKLVKKADKVVSIYIRLLYSDKRWYVKCFTDGKKLKWDDPNMNAGHFISRRCTPLRWDIRNIRPQCFFPCNNKLQGNWEPIIFRKNLQDEIGEEAVLDLESRYFEWKQKPVKVSTPEIEEIIRKYTELAKQEADKRGITLKI